MSYIRIKRSLSEFIQKCKKPKHIKACKSMDDITSSSSFNASEYIGATTPTTPKVDESTFIDNFFQSYLDPSVLDIHRAVKYRLNFPPESPVTVLPSPAGDEAELALEPLNHSEELSLVPPTPLLPCTPVFEDSLSISFDVLSLPCTPSLTCSTPPFSPQRADVSDVSTASFNKPRVMNVADFQSLQFISRGAWGQVHLAKDTVSNRRVALKVMKKAEEMFDIPKVKDLLIQEKNIMEKLRGHRWFAQLEASWCDSVNLYLAMTYYPTDLESEVIRCGKLPTTRAQFYMVELIVALEELHRVGIIHRDVKAANVFIGADGHIVLGDFGLSKDFGQRPTYEDRSIQPYWPFLPGENSQPRTPAELTFVTDEVLGPEIELAPEVVLGEYHSFGVDFWSAGVTLYFMATGTYPWSDEKEKCIERQVVEDEVEFQPEHEVSDECQDLILQMMRKEPSKRIRLGRDLMTHPYFTGVSWLDMRCRAVPAPWVPDFISGHCFYESWKSMEMFKPGHAIDKKEDNEFEEYFFTSPELEQCIETPLERFFTRHSEDEVEDNEKPWNQELEDQCEVATPNGLVKTCTPSLSSSDSYASVSASFHSLASFLRLSGIDSQTPDSFVPYSEPEILHAQSAGHIVISIVDPGEHPGVKSTAVRPQDTMGNMPALFKPAPENDVECIEIIVASMHGPFNESGPLTQTGMPRAGFFAKVVSWLKKLLPWTGGYTQKVLATSAVEEMTFWGIMKGMLGKLVEVGAKEAVAYSAHV